LIFYFEHSTF